MWLVRAYLFYALSPNNTMVKWVVSFVEAQSCVNGFSRAFGCKCAEAGCIFIGD